jgi:hypothetical protein
MPRMPLNSLLLLCAERLVGIVVNLPYQLLWEDAAWTFSIFLPQTQTTLRT